MKKISLVLSVLMLCAITYAQPAVATLVHNGNVKVFYGMDAFKTACDSAVSGDVVTLSPGTFYGGYDLTKNITLRGAGWKGDQNTIIDGDVHLKIPSSDLINHLSIEGIKFRNRIHIDSLMHNPIISKCWIGNIGINNVFNGTVVNCFVNGTDCDYRKQQANTNWQLTFLNSIVNARGDINKLSYVNCIVNGSGEFPDNVLINCIMNRSTCCTNPNTTCTAINCVCVAVGNYFDNCIAVNDTIVDSMDRLFVNLSNFNDVFNNSDESSFELLPAAQTQFLGNDGTQIGVYGGLRPYSDIPSYPRITDTQVAPTSTADGKLDVRIEVTPAQ